MPGHLYLAPAAAGKTAYILDMARSTAQGLAAEVRVVVASHLQVRSARRRLAEMGGAIGVRVLTFDRLYAEILDAAGETFVELSEPVQYRLLRALLDPSLPDPGKASSARVLLHHYAPIADRPGFIQLLRQLIHELKAASIRPEDFTAAVRALGNEPRLAELARIYAAYQARLGAQGWADRAGMGWLALEALRERAPHVTRDWALLAVDGFDNFTPVQTDLLRELAYRVGRLMITLTGEPDGAGRPLAHERLARTRTSLERILGVQSEPLPPSANLTALSRPVRSPALVHLERRMFRSTEPPVDAAGAVELIEAADRAGEVRAALRWLKARLLLDDLRPGQVALLTRDITPYRHFIQQIAAEFGLPIRPVAGLPLRQNPAVAALLSLLQCLLPGGDGQPALPPRPVVEAWRSPYFDWSVLPYEGAPEAIGIAPADADDLDAVARWGRVIGGQGQWDEALHRLADLRNPSGDPGAVLAQEEDRGVPAGLPRGDAARALAAKLGSFLQRIAPPAGAHSYRSFVRWLESLIGPDPFSSPSDLPEVESTSLQVVARACEGEGSLIERDVAALVALKDVLRGLVWAEEALATAPVEFPHFFAELTGALDAASYTLPIQPNRDEILVADAIQARGLPFRAVAVLGLAEGEFPAVLAEDPILRDADRQRLQKHGLALEPSTHSAEAEYFYETAARPSDRLLLTRPRLADNGSPWQASPYWEEVRRVLDVVPGPLAASEQPAPNEAASWPELLESLATHGDRAAAQWATEAKPTEVNAVTAAAGILRQRSTAAGASPFDGALNALAKQFAARFGPDRTWSASRLEAYRSCPFSFFVTHVLGLERREEPAEGLDARQLGNIYHHIFERLYRTTKDPADPDALLAALPAVARAVLDDAPRTEGFRETAWWAQTRDEITANVQRSIESLAALPGGYAPLAQEAAFGGASALTVTDGGDSFRLHGFIDRVDRAPDGSLRIIDYKTAGPSSFTAKAFEEGKKLQLPLYALATEQALGLGQVVDGFYWHVQQAEASKVRLAGGVREAIETALGHAWSAVRGARAGHFVPKPPDGGCPDYCPAVGFCWHTRPRVGA